MEIQFMEPCLTKCIITKEYIKYTLVDFVPLMALNSLSVLMCR